MTNIASNWDVIYMDTDRANYYKVMRLLCLQSLALGGIRTSKYEAIKRLLVQCYGFDQTFTLSNLEKAGRGGKTNHPYIE